MFTTRVVPRNQFVPTGKPVGTFLLSKFNRMQGNERKQVVDDLPVLRELMVVQISTKINTNYNPGASFS